MWVMTMFTIFQKLIVYAYYNPYWGSKFAILAYAILCGTITIPTVIPAMRSWTNHCICTIALTRSVKIIYECIIYSQKGCIYGSNEVLEICQQSNF